MMPLWAILAAAAATGVIALIDHYLPSKQYCIGVAGRLAQAEQLAATPGLSAQDQLFAEQWRGKLKAEHKRCFPSPLEGEGQGEGE